MRRAIPALRLILIISLLFGNRYSLAGLADTIDRVRGAVVAVGTLKPTRSPRAQFMGTGFAVADGRYVVTNKHVIPEKIDFERRERLAVFSGRGKQARGVGADLVAVDAEHDLALLEIDGKPLPAMRLGDSSRVREGERYAFTGFPIGMVLGLYPVTHQGIVSARTPIVIPAISSKQLTAAEIRRMRNPFEVFQLDATAYPGNSGSPLYEIDTGAVIGVINSVYVKGTKESALSEPSGISYAIPARHIVRLLRKAGVKTAR